MDVVSHQGMPCALAASLKAHELFSATRRAIQFGFTDETGRAGGPAGGNGGAGGNVWAVAAHNENSLSAFRRRVHWRADPGTAGGGSKCHGRDGEDLEIPVPPGTIIRARDAQEGDTALAELLLPGEGLA